MTERQQDRANDPGVRSRGERHADSQGRESSAPSSEQVPDELQDDPDRRASTTGKHGGTPPGSDPRE